MHSSTRQRTKVFALGHSPYPDDAFMFYALAENKIDLRGYRFDHRLADIQTLNERAQRGELHIFRDLDSRVSVRCQELRAATVRGEHGRWIRADHCQKTFNPPTPRLRRGRRPIPDLLRAQRALECGGLTLLLTVLRRMKLCGKNKPQPLQTIPIRFRR